MEHMFEVINFVSRGTCIMIDINRIKKESDIYIETKDYSISKENFTLYHNKEYDLLYTYAIPSNLDTYYESEDYISHTDANRSIIDKIYNLVRTYNIQKKEQLISKYICEDKNLLDIGCGTGEFIKYCKSINYKTFGIEPNVKARNLAISKKLEVKSDIRDIKDQKFDIITMWHVLEHVENLDEYISKIKNLLKANGTLIIAVPNFKSYDAKYYKQFWAAYDVPRHIWHFSKKSIIKIFSSYNMEVKKTKPMLFDSFYVSILSEKYKIDKNNYINSFYRGLLSNIKGIRSKEYSSHIYVIKNRNI